MTHSENSATPPVGDSMESPTGGVQSPPTPGGALLYLVPSQPAGLGQPAATPALPETPSRIANNARLTETAVAADALAARVEAAIAHEGRAYAEACELVPADAPDREELLGTYLLERDRRLRALAGLAEQLAEVYVGLEDLVTVVAAGDPAPDRRAAESSRPGRRPPPRRPRRPFHLRSPQR